MTPHQQMMQTLAKARTRSKELAVHKQFNRKWEAVVSECWANRVAVVVIYPMKVLDQVLGEAS